MTVAGRSRPPAAMLRGIASASRPGVLLARPPRRLLEAPSQARQRALVKRGQVRICRCLTAFLEVLVPCNAHTGHCRHCHPC